MKLITSLLFINISLFSSELTDLIDEAKFGNTKAQWELYKHYSEGSSLTPRIFKQKLKWLTILGHKKELKAQKELADLYFYGYTWQLKKDYFKSLYWYKQAIESNNDSESMIQAALMYRKGLGTKKSIWHSNRLFRLAYQYHNDDAKYFIAQYNISVK